MVDLNSSIWSSLEGGYKQPYDASVPLRKLEATNTPAEVAAVYEELWNELHHQGDVGIASYLAVPHLVRIARTKMLFDWNLLGLCCTIEQQRHHEGNPALPVEFTTEYMAALSDLRQFVLENFKGEMNDELMRTALSALATCSGRITLGKAILEMSDDVLEEFLQNY